MARYSDAVCRLCRREGMKLYLKGERCFKEKCSFETRKGKIPGQHGAAKAKKPTGYALQLREKQKVKRIYGLSEQQFRNTFERVLHEPGRTGENLLIALESRLDNIVYRMGLALSRKAARQLVRHRHVEVNGRPVDVPSFQLRPGDEVRVAKASREMDVIAVSLDLASKGQPVSWVAVDRSAMTGKVTERPTRDAIPIAAEEQLIVELYSK